MPEPGTVDEYQSRYASRLRERQSQSDEATERVANKDGSLDT
jgi:hypothetical protein